MSTARVSTRNGHLIYYLSWHRWQHRQYDGGNRYERIFFAKSMYIEYSSWNIRVPGVPQICIDLILISSIRSMTFLSMKSSDLMCIWLTIIFWKNYRHVHHHLTFVTSSAVEDRTINLFTSARHFKKLKLHNSRWKQSSNDFLINDKTFRRNEHCFVL